ncbi:unnamed protein product [Rhizoctonia solani]|uniref:F-box domain-containing protein n=1 Tax=Rhizoctonia solani TaxID=456999 RepID=A0A8H2XWI9_9AGAM|nr:unnamed protein product [Rhizoctonia solani]
MQSINELPVEVLSRIFILGEKMQRGPRALRLPYVGFQDLVVQVCRHWREVAISTPELWTYIFISHPPPHLNADLYISRSGCLPLDIDLDMKSSFIQPIHPFRESEQAERALETLDFIEKAGGRRDRWGSLIIFSKALFAIITIYSFFTRTPTPVLRFVSIKWKSFSDIAQDQEQIGIEKFGLSKPTLAHGPERPRLSHIELNGLPKHFMFDNRLPLVSNLTRFTFVCSETMSLPLHHEFSMVLSASPQLEHLSVDLRDALYDIEEIELEPAAIAPIQVRLPFLRSFLLDTSHLYQWSLHLLQLVDAPGVEYLNLNTEGDSLHPIPVELYEYLAKGRINNVLQCYVPLDDISPDSGPIFPRLGHLNIERMSHSVNNISLIFTTFPMVTHVTIGGSGALALHEYPDYLLNASHFTYINDNSVDPAVVVGFSNSRAAYKPISTFVWCTAQPEYLRMQLGLEDNENWDSGSDRHYHSPPKLRVDHLIIRQIDQTHAYLESDDEAFVSLDDEDDDLGFDVDEFVVTNWDD